jgi:hypothetical protein
MLAVNDSGARIGHDEASQNGVMPSVLVSPSRDDVPGWVTAYPKLIEQMREMMDEWKEEREHLLFSAEKTHAYCQSLAFQVQYISACVFGWVV